MQSPDPQKLEDIIHKALRALPDRAAPRTLEARVLMAVGRRAALPWWRRSYAQWPVSVRCAFMLLLAAAAAAVYFLSRSNATAQAVGAVAMRIPWFAFLQSAYESLAESVRVVSDAIPQTWLYGSVALIAGCYALLIGLAVVAHRVFFGQKNLFGPITQ